jgi:hypothetical protein
MSTKTPSRYELPESDAQVVEDYRWPNIRLALSASIPKFLGGTVTLLVGAYLAVEAIRDATEPNWDVLVTLVCLPLAMVAVAVSAMQFRAISRLIRQGWNSPTRKIQRPGRSEWDHFGPRR